MYSRNWHSVLIATVVINLSLASHAHCWQKKNKQTDDEPKVLVLVPVVELPAYHLFKDSKQFTMVEWPKSRLREDVQETITSFEQVKGKVSRHYKLRAIEPIYKSDVSQPNFEHDGVENHRGDVAYAILLPLNRYPVGFIKKSDRLDILATLQPFNSSEPLKTMFILEDIEVLDVDKGTNNAAAVVVEKNRILLRLTAPQALMLKFFEDTAKLDAVRRNPGDPTRIRHHFSLTPDINTSALPYEAVPEQKVLNQWIGHWRTSYQQTKAERTPTPKSGTAEIEVGSVMNGQFVQESSYYSDGSSNRLLFNYDATKKHYRAWWFSSTGQTEESTGKWDADQKTMTWSSTGNQDAVTIVKHHFKDSDTIEFDVITKDRGGKLIFHMEGKRSRVKSATK